ncbi:MAG: J domain-containing protein [Dehalococcoidia bacterium]|nr:MAG: J domain-containing protein [Dehalococcoidia bacterium]
MKDYYDILEISEKASQQAIRSAFRKLAFRHHPDTNPGNESQAAARFKEINEAYAVLGDRNKRQQYDYARKHPFARADYGGFQYSQQDIFQSIFANQAFVNELNRMFSQAGLRFDRDFMNQVFSGGSSNSFYVYTKSGSKDATYQDYSPGISVYKQSWLECLFTKAITRISHFMLKRLLGIEYKPNLDLNINIDITPEEVVTGNEKEISYKRGGREKKLIVKIPSSARTGSRIRLKGMGLVEKNKAGDLYLHIKVKGKTPLNPS